MSVGLFYITYGFTNEKLITLNNLTELKQLINKNKTKKKLKILCLLQLQKKIIPYSCYKLIKQISSFKKTKPLVKYLDEKCIEFSVSIKKLTELKKIIEKKTLSPTCRKAIYQQKSRIEYQLRDGVPEDILKWYFKEDF